MGIRRNVGMKSPLPGRLRLKGQSSGLNKEQDLVFSRHPPAAPPLLASLLEHLLQPKLHPPEDNTLDPPSQQEVLESPSSDG